MLGVVSVLARGVGDARRFVERRLGAVEKSRAQLGARQKHQVVRANERGSHRRVRGQALLEDAQPALQIAELDERPADERRRPVQLLRDPVRVADDGQLLVGALDLARRTPGEMHEHLEEQRERARLRVIERAGGGHGLLDDGEPGVGESAQRRRARELAAAKDAGLDAGLPYARAVKRRVVQRHGLLEVLVSGFERAEMEERGADRPFADHLQVRVAEALEERHHLERDVVGDADLARDHMVRRHADEDRDDARRIVHLAAELARALVRLADLGDGVALARLDRQGVGHEQPELGGRSRRARRFAREQRQPALRQARRLVVRVQTPGRLGRPVPVFGGAHAVARDFEEHGDLRQAIALFAIARRQPLGDRAAERRLPRRTQRVEARVLVHVVREPVAQRERPIRRLELARKAHEGVLALQPFETRLDVLLVRLHGGGDDGRIEVHALDARGRQEAAVAVLERIHLALDQARVPTRAARGRWPAGRRR